MPLTAEIKQAEKDISRLQDEIRDASTDLASAQSKFEGKSLIEVSDKDPEYVALLESGRKHDLLKDQLIQAVTRVKEFDRDASTQTPVAYKGIPESPEVKSWRERFEDIVSDDNAGFKAAMQKYASGSEAGALGKTDLGELASRDNVKALITRGQGGIDNLVRPDRRALIDESAYAELTLLDLVTIGSTDQNAIEYPAFLGRTGAAAVIPDPTSGVPESATLKPDIGLNFAIRDARVRTIAAGVPVFRNTLEDNTAYLRTVIREQLYDAIRTELQAQILAGSGTGENFTGILNVSGTVPIVAGGAGHVGEPKVEALLRAITQLRLTGDQGSAYVVNPIDFEAIRLSKDDNGQYHYGPPSIQGPLTVWGKPVVNSIAIPQGTVLLADWSKVQLLIRKGISLLTSDSHKDYFMRNLIQWLAEMRAALLVTRPGAIAKITGL